VFERHPHGELGLPGRNALPDHEDLKNSMVLSGLEPSRYRTQSNNDLFKPEAKRAVGMHPDLE